MTNKMFVVTHKPFSKPNLDGYYSLLVGANKNLFSNSDYFDNSGDNISDKNKNFCELTGLYWIWKNDNADIVGLCHYRRYFTNSYLTKKAQHYISSQDIRTLMERYDMVLPNIRYYKETVYDAINIAPNLKDIEEIKKALRVVQPDYLSDFDAFLNGNEAYLFNMFITKKEILNKYCEWLFSILFYIEADYDISNEDDYRQRLFGFLSERLIYVWVMHNIDKGRIKHVRVVKSDEPNVNTLFYDVKNEARRIYFNMFIKRGNRDEYKKGIEKK